MRHLQSENIIKNRILFNLVKNEGKRLKHARELGQSLLRKRSHARPNAKLFIRRLTGEAIRARLTKRFAYNPRKAAAKAAAKSAAPAPAAVKPTKAAPAKAAAAPAKVAPKKK